jgi:hypothetical protein
MFLGLCQFIDGHEWFRNISTQDKVTGFCCGFETFVCSLGCEI